MKLKKNEEHRHQSVSAIPPVLCPPSADVIHCLQVMLLLIEGGGAALSHPADQFTHNFKIRGKLS